MIKLKIEKTNNPDIIKLVADDFLVKGNFLYKNIDQAKESPLAQELFYLPFIKTVYVEGNFIALERYSIVRWDDVQEEVKEKIEDYINSGKTIVREKNDEKKIAVTVYAESTPNPSVIKFVSNKKLVDRIYEFQSVEQATNCPLAVALFKFPFVKEVFLDSNYVAVMKYNIASWDDIVMELREFIRKFLSDDKEVVVGQNDNEKKKTNQILDEYSQKIVDILDKYVRPAVSSDGGNIEFVQYDKDTNVVKVLLQGACSGCPSSTMTLKNGIENLLREMLKSDSIVVDAIN